SPLDECLESQWSAGVEVPGDSLVMLGMGDVIEPVPRRRLDGNGQRERSLADLGQARVTVNPLDDHQLASRPCRTQRFEHGVAPIQDVQAALSVRWRTPTAHR